VLDPFATLGLPRKFGLDLQAAEAKHLQLSRTLHPDKHAASGAAERRMALSRAIEVNEAWRAVRDPIKRAETLLILEGLGGEVGETREPKPSGAFLMEVLEARERLDDAKQAKDASLVHEVLVEAKAQHAQAITTLERALDDALAAGDLETKKTKLRAAIPLLGRLRYAARFLSEAVASEDELAGF
jgi:molecular chaperone HscB